MQPIEYIYAKAQWRVEDGRGLSAEFGLEDGAMPELHRCLRQQERMWQVACRRFGIRPMMDCSDPMQMTGHEMGVVADLLGMERAEADALLAQAVAVWRRWSGAVGAVPAQEEISGTQEAELLTDFGFVEVKDAVQRQYLARRIQELRPVLDTGDAKMKARAMLTTELMLNFDIEAQMRAISRKMKEAREGKAAEPSAAYEERFSKLVKTHGEMQKSIQEASEALGLSELQSIGARKKFQFRECIGQMIEAIRLFHSEGDRALIDGIHTAGEVLIQTTPFGDRKPQYRPDLPVMATAWVEGLFDPEAKFGGLAQKAHRRLAKGFKGGLALALADEGAVMGELDDAETEEAIVEASQVPAALTAPPTGTQTAPMQPPRTAADDEVSLM